MWSQQGGGGFPPATRRLILTRDPTCTIAFPGCTGVSTEADHVTPKHMGGTDDPSNGRGACHPCHGKVTQQQAQAGRAAWKRPTRRHPGLRA